LEFSPSSLISHFFISNLFSLVCLHPCCLIYQHSSWPSFWYALMFRGPTTRESIISPYSCFPGAHVTIKEHYTSNCGILKPGVDFSSCRLATEYRSCSSRIYSDSMREQYPVVHVVIEKKCSHCYYFLHSPWVARLGESCCQEFYQHFASALPHEP
jgi:hypothetical protein